MTWYKESQQLQPEPIEQDVNPTQAQEVQEEPQDPTQWISKQDFERMMQMAYNLNKEWLIEEDTPVKTWQQWLQGYDYQGIGDAIDSYSELHDVFLKDLPDGVGARDLILAYKDNKLVNVSQYQPRYVRPEMPDLKKERRKLLPWEKEPSKEKSSEEVRSIYKEAISRLSSSTEKTVAEARKQLFYLYNSDKKLAEKLNISDAELNKKIRDIIGFPTTSRDLENDLNAGIPEEHQWAGITNSAFIGRQKLTIKDLDGFVKKVDVTKEGQEYFKETGDMLRRYIASVFMAIDTRINYQDLTFEIGKIDRKSDGVSTINGIFYSDTNTIRISSVLQSTVAHEIGHYIDYKFAREFSSASAAIGLSEAHYISEKSEYHRDNFDVRRLQWADKYRKFVNEIMRKSDMTSSYAQSPREVFARFVAKFVEWTIDKSGARYSSNMHYGQRDDKFDAGDYKIFVYLLQEKSWLDKNVPLKQNRGKK